MSVHKRFCKRCGGWTYTDISFDIDSNPGEPSFIEQCLRCEGVNNFLDVEPDLKQKQLNLNGGMK